MIKKFKILDIGCGTNLRGDIGVERFITSKERRKYGGLGKDQIHLPKHKPFIKATGMYLPIKSRTFRRIICWSAIEHMSQPYLALCEIRRVLKRGGIVLFQLPDAYHLGCCDSPSHLYTWSSDSFQNLLRYVGFKIIKVRSPVDNGPNMRVFARK